MRRFETLSGCACCPLNRRRFLATGCAACAGATGLLGASGLAHAADKGDKTKIRVIHALHADVQPRADWPNVGFDFRPVMARISATLKKECPDFDFVTSKARNANEVQKIIDADKTAGIDGYLVYQLNCWNRVVQPVLKTDKPVLYADFQYGGSGGFLVYTAGLLRRKQPNFAFVASSNPKDLVAAVKCFEIVKKGGSVEQFVAATEQVRKQATPAPGKTACKADDLKPLSAKDCRAAMRRAKILTVGRTFPKIVPAITEQMGIEVVAVPFAELNAAWEGADKEQSKEIADRWQETAEKIEKVSRKTLEQSAAMYLAQKEVLKKHDANAITINCLGGFYGGHIHAYPCMGFHELNNEGLIGACECDVRSTSTMVAMTAMTKGRPGFISDPVIDTAKGRIIYAHCVASNKAFGPRGKANPFEILTHSEDRKGAAVRSIFPLGYMTTTVEFGPDRKQILFHQGKAVENVDDDRACRTKLAVEPVGDIEKLFRHWDQWSWHRVTYFGDLKEPVFALADALGWKVVEEA